MRVGARRGWWRYPAVAAAVVAGFVGLLAGQRWLDHGLVRTVDNLTQLLAAVAAAVLCGRAGARAGWRRGRLWWLLCAAAFSWSVGQLIWMYYELVRGVEVPFPSVADAGFLGFSVFAVAALLSFPAA